MLSYKYTLSDFNFAQVLCLNQLDSELVIALLRFDLLLIPTFYEHEFDKLLREVTPSVIYSSRPELSLSLLRKEICLFFLVVIAVN